MSKRYQSRSWFAVFNNPEDHGYSGSPEEICDRLCREWIGTSKTRSGAWAYCISADGLHHVHMILEDSKMMDFANIKKSYCLGMHFEFTRGNKLSAEDYINKRGKYEEKGEKVVCIKNYGEVKACQGSRSDLISAHDLIMEGYSISDVLESNPNFYRYEKYIKSMYYAKRSSETPIVRDVKVIWHWGESGSGKSYSRIQLAESVGEENIYYLTAFGSGAFDNYNGQKYLWIEDFKGEMKFGDLLRILDVYKAEISARYANVKALWNEVHITSIFHPREVYFRMVDGDVSDKVEQLLRRIDVLQYHYYCQEDNSYASAIIPMSVYTKSEALHCAVSTNFKILLKNFEKSIYNSDCL